MSQAANHSINPGFITVIVISRPPASSLQDVRKQGGRIILIQHSDRIFFKSNFLLHLLRRCSSKTELGRKDGLKVLKCTLDWEVMKVLSEKFLEKKSLLFFQLININKLL